MLPSGAHVKIGSYEYMVDVAAGDSFVDFYDTLYAQGSEIDGTPGKRTANPRFLFWRFDDWSGGEDVKYFDTQDPTTYWYGSVNPRVPGSITSPPTLSATTGLTTTTATPEQLLLVSAAGTLWLLAGREAFYSTNGTSWTAHANNALGAASDMMTAACSTGDEIWYSSYNGANRLVFKLTTGADESAAVSSVSGKKFLGMAEMEGMIFGWSGKVLFRFNSQASLPITQADKHKVYKTHLDAPAGTYYGDCVAAENRICFMTAYKGDTTIYMFRKHGFPLQNIEGFTGKALAYKQGVLGILGEEDGKVVLNAINLQTRQPFRLANVGRYVSATTATCLAPGPGSSFIMGVSDGTTNFFFVYDMERDSISELDEQTIASKGTADDMVYYDSRRLAAYFASTTVKADSWISDDSTPAGAWTWYSGAHDLGYPMDQKVLCGFHVTQDPGIAAGTGTVYYQDDEDGTWTTAGTWSAASKHTYIDVSADNVKFRTLRVKIVGASGSRMLSCTARTYITTQQRAWQMKLKLKNERQGDRPSSRMAPAHVLRTNLHALAADGGAITFLNGFRFPHKGGASDGYTSHTVLVESVEDHIASDAEGTATVVLRAVTPV